jgi:rhamnulokinase
MAHCLVLDFGGSSIRLLDVGLVDQSLSLSELARMPHRASEVDGQLVWNYRQIFSVLESRLTEAGKSGVRFESIGADSWGVDYVLLDEDGAIIGSPVSYRDRRTEGMPEMFFAGGSLRERLYAVTGVQGLAINTIFQLFAQSLREPEHLKNARHLLLTADYVHYWLSGVAANEYTLATTSQMLSLDGGWAPEIVARLPLPANALHPPVAPGTLLGDLRPALAMATGLHDVKVIAPAAHDTASAILAIPAADDGDWAYVSSGTWSIIGTEVRKPVVSKAADDAGLTNEGGYGGTYCLQATVTGLWIVQEIIRCLNDGSDSRTLAHLAEVASPFRSLINPADPRFFNPGNMIAEIRAACEEAGEPVPRDAGELARCAYDSLALLYRATLVDLAALTGRRFVRLHMVGGGAQAELLNHLCAAATGLPVLSGPAEATALGNAIAQFVALGHLPSVSAGRQAVLRSFPPRAFTPKPVAGLDIAIIRFSRLRAHSTQGQPA